MRVWTDAALGGKLIRANAGKPMARILIIEDTPANLLLTMAILEGAGHTSVTAPNAECGLDLAAGQAIDLILMDMRLPGMDGIAATRLLKNDARTRSIPIVALTALAMRGDEERMLAAGCAGYVAKPLRYRELLEAVDAALPLGGSPTEGRT